MIDVIPIPHREALNKPIEGLITQLLTALTAVFKVYHLD